MVEHELVRLLLAFASQLTKQADPIKIQVCWHRLANSLQQGGHDIHLGGLHAQFRVRNDATPRPPDQNLRLQQKRQPKTCEIQVT